MSTTQETKTVSSVLDVQRKEGEARDLLKDLQKLISLTKDRKARWVWELIQNAVDCSTTGKVSITISLEDNKVIFSHDGDPFQIENLVAIVRKTSTKSVEGLEGKKGKFGTGFISTHVLNLKATISGTFKNEKGLRNFNLAIDRSSDDLNILMNSLVKSFRDIDAINILPPDESKDSITNFEYNLESDKLSIANDGINELKRDLAYTLLINRDQLNTVTIIVSEGKSISFSAEEPGTVFEKMGFAKIKNSDNTIEHQEGILFHENANLTVAFPVILDTNGSFSLSRIGHQARIFRNFPLIGTDNFHQPCLLHSEFFQPTEPRDGIRTLKDSEDKPDKHADENRRILEVYVEDFKTIFKILKDNDVKNLHLLAESGMPADPQNYLAMEWFQSKIQQPLRKFILEQPIVKTVSGQSIRIASAKFIRADDSDGGEDLYELVSKFFADHSPDKESFKDWEKIIFQEEDLWPKGIYVNIENLCEEVSNLDGISELKLFNSEPIRWLNDLVDYINKKEKLGLAEKHKIFLAQSGLFRLRLDLRLDPGFSDRFKTISKTLYRNLFDEFISEKIENQQAILKFDTEEYFTGLNKFIGNLDVAKTTAEQVSTMFELGSHFKNTNAPKRTEWFGILNELLPELASEKITTEELNDYEFESVDKWTLRYVSYIVHKSIKFLTFKDIYFAGDSQTAYSWLNRFLQYATGTEENRDAALRYNIFLTQDGLFKKFDTSLVLENTPNDFEPLFKDMIKEDLGKSDPRIFLIDSNIASTFVEAKDADYLTTQIDKIFNDPGIEDAVQDGGRYNLLFHKLNSWYTNEEEKEKERPGRLFPSFRNKRPELSVRAYGKEMSRIMAEKGIEEIKALTNLKLKAEELSILEKASELAGGPQVLVEKANEIFEEAERIRWRKEVGTSAEVAFKNLIEGIETHFNLENPDDGKDFTIKNILNGKEYFIEIKSTIIGQENVKMSPKQGNEAQLNRSCYALCVITRPSGTKVSEQHFYENAKFVTNIGELIGDKIDVINEDIQTLIQHEQGDVNVTIDNKTYSIYVRKKIWEAGIDINAFIEILKNTINTITSSV